jgi:DNA modification methylase
MVELAWEGKYDKSGKKTAPLKISLPLQTVETINESSQERQKSIDLFLHREHSTAWRNRVIWGDKKYVLPSLLPEFAGKINMVYIDPPFDTGEDFSYTARVPDGEDEVESFLKEPSIIEQKAWRDTWGKGLDSYLQWMWETLLVLRDLMHPDGSIYVHLDWHVSHYVKPICDEVFSPENFRNEIVWKRTTAHSHAKQGTVHYARVHDVLLFYGNSESATWNQPYVEHSDKYVESTYRSVDPETGRYYALGDLTVTNGGPKGNPKFKFLGIERYWRYNKEKMMKLLEAGKIVQASPGAVPRLKRYLDESPGTEVSSIWTDISPVGAQAQERVGYATQKPEALLERIMTVSTRESDLVLDCFVGSGTTAIVAEKLNRRWIACDLSKFAIHTTRKRLLSVTNVKPFVIQNLGKYERQIWQAAEFGESSEARVQSYRQFVLQLYNATPIVGYSWLHGIRSGRMVHVGAVDSPIAPGDVTQILTEFRKAIGTGTDAPRTNGVDVLGWDFAFELNELAKQQASQAKVDLRFLRIPRDVLDKKAVEQGDIKFFELGSLGVDLKKKGRKVSVELTDFVIPPDDVPQDVQKNITHWSQWIDYIGVDWDNRSDTFHNEWQSYRSRKNPELQTVANHTYQESGQYVIVVKVVDILGNDTTKSLKVQI